MTTTKVVLREGDVFRFSYSEAERAKRFEPHHCFDGQVVVRGGKLCDTYWGFDGNEPRIVTPEQGELRFLCNLGDVRDIRPHEERHYAPEDVFNLSYQHGCYKRYVVNKGAAPNAERMLKEIAEKMHDTERQIQSACRSLMELAVVKSRIEAGDLSRKPWW